MATSGVEPHFAEAAEELARRDPDLARWIEHIGPPAIRPPSDSYFAALSRSIVFQQLAGRAAAAIHGRFVAAVGGQLSPEAVLATPEADLRAAGLSANKFLSLRDLSQRVINGEVPLDDLDSLADDDIVARLSAVRGIGRWTAEMFLIFQLRRPDVWPVDDLGVRRGYAVIHGLAEWPKPKQLMELGDRYRPFRTVAAWYCWRTADTVLPE
ncbi:MAG TPA: DNA-3-methyladenine glycosylase 2 family protein [Candidatus Dormibacteraeota bacterium]